MMKMYKVDVYGSNTKIVAVEVERFNDKTVWLKGRMERRFTGYFVYLTSWKEAHDYLMERMNQQVKEAHKAYALALHKRRRLRMMKEEDCEG